MRGSSANVPTQAAWDTVADYNIGNALSIGNTFRFALDKIRSIRNGGIWRSKGDVQLTVKWYTKGDCDLTGYSSVNDPLKCTATTDPTLTTGFKGKTITYPVDGIGGYWEGSPGWKCNGLIPNGSSELWNLCRDQATNPGDWGCSGASANAANCNFSLWTK